MSPSISWGRDSRWVERMGELVGVLFYMEMWELAPQQQPSPAFAVPALCPLTLYSPTSILPSPIRLIFCKTLLINSQPPWGTQDPSEPGIQNSAW